MKKVYCFLLSLLLTFFLNFSFVSAQSSELKIMIENEYIEAAVSPIIINNRTLVPARVIIENLGGTIQWNQSIQEIKIKSDTIEISLIPNELYAIVNNEKIELDVPAQIIEDNLMVPLRFISETLMFNVEFTENTIYITKSIFEKPEVLPVVTDNDYPEFVTDGNIAITTPIKRNEQAFVKFSGKPDTSYSIAVIYLSGKSTAEGLETVTSDSNGNIEWSWKIGGRTTFGTYKVIITGGGETFETTITITN